MTATQKTKGIIKFRSIQSLFFGAMLLLIATLSLPIFINGVSIMDSLIEDIGIEILNGELQGLLNPVDLRYQTLARVGLEDSRSHRQEIKDMALKSFGQYRYKNTGTAFVVDQDQRVIVGDDFQESNNSPEFIGFFEQIMAGKVVVIYEAQGKEMYAAARYYGPWQSYVGISMTRDELFAPRDLFVRLNQVILAIVLVIAIVFVVALNLYIITPILRLTRFANKVSRGAQSIVPGRFVFELADMRNNMVRMVRKLKGREEKYRAIFDAPSDGIFIHDPDDGHFLEINAAVFDMFGFRPQELFGRTVAEVSAGYYPYTMEGAAERIRKTLTDGPQRFEWHCRKKDGTLFWAEVSLRAMQYGDGRAVLALVRDVDNQKKFAEELAAEKEQLAITLRSIADGVITTDNEDRVVLVNKVAEVLTGWGQDEAVGKRLTDVLCLSYQKTEMAGQDSAQDIWAAEQTVQDFGHMILVARDGTRRVVAHSSASIFDPAGAVVGVVLVFRDITEQQRMEQEVLKVKKLESVGILAGGIAHDFNNILAAILGNINLSRMELKGGSKADLLLEEAEKASLRARSLTQQLLTFSRGGDPVLEAADIAEIIKENADFVLRGSSVRCEFSPPAGIWQVEIDPGQIGQVIQNIILNAREAMGARGGVIQISCENYEQCLSYGKALSEGCVTVIIKDDGPGMAPEVIGHIFDPYFSTKEKGSGLGLAISHSILYKHGGFLGVESELGVGTTFTVKLPVHDKSIPVDDDPEYFVSEVCSARILIMDDEEMILEMATQILEYLGHEVVTAGDGDLAVELYRQAKDQGEPFTMVIMDLTIPGGKGGQEAVKEILAFDATAKVVVASGYCNDPVMANYKEYGFSAKMNKPFMVRDLQEALAAVLAPVVGSPEV